MGSVTFNSEDGFSRVHDHVITDIRCVKNLLPEDEDVIVSLGLGFLEDCTWIAGEDRAYFAARLRSVLSTQPEGEWSFRGLKRFDTPEELDFAEDCAGSGARVPGIHSIIEHLEGSDIYPVVITNSVTASFPYFSFDAEGRPITENADYDYEGYEKFEKLSDAEQWGLIWPEFLKLHADKRWRSGATTVASSLRDQFRSVGFWRNLLDRSDFEDGVLDADGIIDLRSKFETSLLPFAAKVIDELVPAGDIYIVGEEPTFAAFGEVIARHQENRLVGVGCADMRISPFASGIIGRVKTYHMNVYAEDAFPDHHTTVVCVPILASADVVIDLIKLILPSRGRGPLVIICGLINAHQASVAIKELEAQGGAVVLRALETVDFDIMGVWRFSNELPMPEGVGLGRTSKWLFKRQIQYLQSAKAVD